MSRPTGRRGSWPSTSWSLDLAREERVGIMASCCASTCAAGEYFGKKLAERELRGYRQKGPDKETRLLLDRLLACRPLGDSLLDVGGGVGVLSFELLSSGIRRATIVDASLASLEAARTEA